VRPGWLHGVRIRKNFKTREEAAAEKATLELNALQAASGLRTAATSLRMISAFLKYGLLKDWIAGPKRTTAARSFPLSLFACSQASGPIFTKGRFPNWTRRTCDSNLPDRKRAFPTALRQWTRLRRLPHQRVGHFGYYDVADVGAPITTRLKVLTVG